MPTYDWDERRMATDPLDAAIAMERAGLLTARAAGIIARFSALSDTVVFCGYHRATGRGWVTYCGVTYTPMAFNTLVAEETGGNACASSTSGEALDDLDDDEPPLPPRLPVSPRPPHHPCHFCHLSACPGSNGFTRHGNWCPRWRSSPGRCS